MTGLRPPLQPRTLLASRAAIILSRITSHLDSAIEANM